MIYTYQDFERENTSEESKAQFVLKAINKYKCSEDYKKAVEAEEYFKGKNRTIMRFVKWLYTVTGRQIEDPISANYKLPHNYFKRFILQEVQHLLGNGINWENENATLQKLGSDIDTQLQWAARKALIEKVSYCFYNLDKIDVFTSAEFCPLWDEENGGLCGGIRFWQIDKDKPLRATLYEIDGYTEYRKPKDGNIEILQEKKPYIITISGDQLDFDRNTTIIEGQNYPDFPIIPLWGNQDHTFQLDEYKSMIDCIDLIESGFANTIDDTAEVFWILQNAGGMDDLDLERFRERVKMLRAYVMEDDGATAQPHTIDVPYQARETLLDRLRRELYESAMVLDTQNIANGAVTATQIRAAYEPLNTLCDDFEYCILDFLEKLCNLAGIEENPSFTRSGVINVAEEIQTTMQAAAVLPQDYVVTRVLTLFGDKDKAEEIIKQIEADQLARFEQMKSEAEQGEEEDEKEENEKKAE